MTDWSKLTTAVVKTPFKGLLSVNIQQVNLHGVIAHHKLSGLSYKFKLDGTPTGHTSAGYTLHEPSEFTQTELEKFF